MLKKVNGFIAGAAVIGVASLCFSACGAHETDAEQPGKTPTGQSGSGGRDEAWAPAMWEGLRETPVRPGPGQERHLLPPNIDGARTEDGQRRPRCVSSAVAPGAVSSQSTTSQLSIPLTALPVCREEPPSLKAAAPSQPVASGEVELVQRAAQD